MRKIFFPLLTIFLIAFSGIIQANQTVYGSKRDSNHVLLVYDSQNTVEQGEKKIDTLQRILAGIGLKVTTIKESEYQKGELSHGYQGVITMINWEQAQLINPGFIKDRDQYDGIKLHIGEGLDTTEQQQLQVKLKTIYQQQLILKDGNSTEMMPFVDRMDVLTGIPKEVQRYGELKTRDKDQQSYAYGIINRNQGYLPFFNNTGLGLITTGKMIATLFDRQQETKPLLTIANVTPYSNLKILDELSSYCENLGVPFAVSTTTVAKNTEMDAYKRFTRSLRRIEDRGGVIFLQAPVIGGATVNNASELSELFDNYLLNLAQNQVYPVGISAQGFWDQDQVLRNNALKKANYWMLFPNKKVVYLKQDNQGETSSRSYLALAASGFNKIKNQEDVRFAMPIALTFNMPDSKVRLKNLKEQIHALNFTWQNPAEDFNSKIEVASSLIAYQNGQYSVNGKVTEVKTVAEEKSLPKPVGTPALFKEFFKVQGRIITVFFAIIFLVLAIFIAFGRKIYKNMFKR